MPLSSSIVEASSEAVASEIDSRWTMAYAAALGETLPCYLDTRHPENLVAHPLFPVCFEWPLLAELSEKLRDSQLERGEARRGVHATHDLLLYRPIRPPKRLWTRLTVAGVERRKPGAYQLTRLDTVDASGAAVCTTWFGTIYRGVEVVGPDRPAQAAPAPPLPANPIDRARAERVVAVASPTAHIYTECARIWNPIHTDVAVATSAGLPRPILHGTATLALAVSQIVAAEAANDPTRVARITARFSAMVFMPSEIVVRILGREKLDGGEGVYFEVLNSEGKPAIRDGCVGMRG